MYSLHTKTFK